MVVFMTKDWKMVLEDYGFSRSDNIENFGNITSMVCGNIRIDVFGVVLFTARIKVGNTYRGEPIAGAQGSTENEAFSNLLKCTVCKGGVTIADIIGIKE
jgi:hypothetical protein